MYKLALLGRDISYTRSPAVHSAIARAVGAQIDFKVVDVSYDDLGDAVNRLFDQCDGFFVTKPYKTDIKRYLGETETRCGVNFVRCCDKRGFNTDGIGFIRALDKNFCDWRKNVNAALVLGAGGAAYSVAEALAAAGKRVYVLNRTMINAAKLCSVIGAQLYVNQPTQLIVNCTSVGVDGEDVLSELCVLPEFEYAFDLIYSTETPFLRRCRNGGATVCDGRDMLIYQAIEGDKILFAQDLDADGLYEEVASAIDGQS